MQRLLVSARDMERIVSIKATVHDPTPGDYPQVGVVTPTRLPIVEDVVSLVPVSALDEILKRLFRNDTSDDLLGRLVGATH